jgi:peptidoglycan/LPS O-acetylase OafA/YrhL
MAAIWLTFACFFVAVSAQNFEGLTSKLERVNAYRDLFLEDLRSVEDAFDGMRDFWYEDMKSLLLEASELGGNQSRNLSAECLAGSAKLLDTRDPVTKLPLIVKMIDAMGKIGPGIMEGNLYARGAYDECFDVGPGYTEYCIGDVSLQLPPQVPLKSPIPLKWNLGMCVPRGCTPEDVAYAVEVVTYGLADASLSTLSCKSTKKPPFNAGAIVMIIVCFIIGFVVIGATAFDYVQQSRNEAEKSGQFQDGSEKTPLLRNGTAIAKKPRRVKAEEFITAFSLLKVLPQILSMKQPPSAITSINGLRVITMFWVILAHTHFLALETDLDNITHLISTMSRFSFQPLCNAFFAVDTFFVMSGLLVTYLSMRQMKRKKGRFPFLTYYLHRYLRLTPTYAFVLFFIWLLIMHLADGPIYPRVAWEESAGYQNCKRYWWTNLLYINNIYPWKMNDGCIYWSWYLANDMQFYVFSPLIIIPLYFLFPLGLAISAVVILICLVISGTLASVYDHQANQLSRFAYNYTGNSSIDMNYGNLLYDKPWHRVAPYIVGLVLGYILYRFRMPTKTKRFVTYPVFAAMWIISGILLVSTLYGLYFTWHNHFPTTAENVLYITFSRLAWSLGVALIVIICHYGYGGLINWFLSLSFWIPLSRLSYNAYLLHPFLLMVIFGSARKPTNYQDYNLLMYSIGMVVLSFGASAVISVFVEFPIGNLEQVLFKMAGIGRHESTRTGGGGEHRADVAPQEASLKETPPRSVTPEPRPAINGYNIQVPPDTA